MFKNFIKVSFVFFVIIIFVVAVFRTIENYAFFAKADTGLLEVDFIDVGQGDASLIRTPDKQEILIDGGESEKILEELSKIISPFDKYIDLLILTHPHSDHVGGLNFILDEYEVGQVLYTGAIHNSPEYISFLEKIKEKEIVLEIVDHPQKIILGDDLFLEIVYPFSKENNTSIVAKLAYKDTTFLFTGDIEEEIEEAILENYSNLDVDVLKVPHHGSDTSNTVEFLDAVQADYAVISVGANNYFGHPKNIVISRLERGNVETFRTDLQGTISFSSNGENISVVTEK